MSIAALYTSLGPLGKSCMYSLSSLGCTQEKLDALYTRAQPTTGIIPDYIPELIAVENIHETAIGVGDVCGNVLNVGSGNAIVSAQSISKVFLYLYALSKGVDPFSIAGTEAVGLSFGQDPVTRGASRTAAHPLNNAGGISAAGEVHDREEFLSFVRILTKNSSIDIMKSVYLSEKDHRQNNLKIAAALSGTGRLTPATMYTALDTYTKACSLGVCIVDLLHAATVLARGGKDEDGNQIVLQDHVVYVLNAMNTYGLYNATGKMALMGSGASANTSKSGVSGYVMTVKPGVGAFVTLGHFIDHIGNSVFGMKAGLVLHEMISEPGVLRLTMESKQSLLREYEEQVRSYTIKTCLKKLKEGAVSIKGYLLSKQDIDSLKKQLEQERGVLERLMTVL